MDAIQFMGLLAMRVSSTFSDYWTALLNPQFERPYLLLLLPVLLYFTLMWGKRQVTIVHSTLAPHKGMRSWSTLVVAAYAVLGLSVTNMTVAMMGPKLTEAMVERLATTRDICNAIDSSGSMQAVLEEGAKELAEDEIKAQKDPGAITVDSRNNDQLFIQSPKKDEPPHQMNRSEGAQLAARFLIRNRMSDDPDNTDRFCLIRFDDGAYMMAPLTNDKLVLLLRTAHITENVGGGTNFIVALEKLYDYFTTNSAPNATRVAIITTDGYDSIELQKRTELIARFKEARIRLYVIGLGEGWKEGNNLDLQKFADELHKADPKSGYVFRAANPGQMRLAMQKIDEQEKALTVVTSTPVYRSADYAFIIGALAFCILFFAFASLARRIP